MQTGWTGGRAMQTGWTGDRAMQTGWTGDRAMQTGSWRGSAGGVSSLSTTLTTPLKYPVSLRVEGFLCPNTSRPLFSWPSCSAQVLKGSSKVASSGLATVLRPRM